MTSISPKTYWIIAIAAVVVIGVLVYWSKVSRVPSPDLSGVRQQNQAAQRTAANRAAAAQQTTTRALEEAAKAANPLLVENPFKKVQAKLTNPF